MLPQYHVHDPGHPAESGCGRFDTHSPRSIRTGFYVHSLSVDVELKVHPAETLVCLPICFCQSLSHCLSACLSPPPPPLPPPRHPFTLAPTAYVSTSNLIRIRFVADITVLFWVWSVFVLHFGEDIATSVSRCRCCHGAVSGRDMVIVLVIQTGFVCHVRGRVRHYGGVCFVL